MEFHRPPTTRGKFRKMKLGLRRSRSLPLAPAHECWANDRVSRQWLLDARNACDQSRDLRSPDHDDNRAPVETYSNPRSLVLVVLLLFLITLRPPAGRVLRRRSDNATQRATPKSLLLLRLVPSFDRDHRPEDLEQAEADEEQRAPGQRELREGARLALRPVCGTSSQKYAIDATVRATARRRGGRGLDAAAARTAG